MSVTTGTVKPDAGSITLESVSAFLFNEARLIDELRFNEWLSCWASECTYWVPSNDYDIDPRKHVSLIYDDRARIEERVRRLTQKGAHSQEPRSRTTHLLTGIQLDSLENGSAHAHAAQLVVELRSGRQQIFDARVDYVLVLEEDELRLAGKKVLLRRNDSPIENLSFLL